MGRGKLRFAAGGAWASLIVALVSCGAFESSSENDADAGGVGVDADGGAASDAAVDVAGDDAGPATSDAACDLDADFQAPTPLDIEGHDGLFLFTLTPDELTLYYETSTLSDGGVGRIYRAQRPNLEAPFGPPVEVLNLSPPKTNSVGRPTLSGDGLTMVFLSDVAPDGLRIATRSLLSVEFAAPKSLSLTDGTGSYRRAALSFDGRTLFYREGTKGGVFASTRVGDDFPPGGRVTSLTTDDGPPLLLRDGKRAYFTRSGADAVDIFHADRDESGTFGTAVREPPVLNTVDQETVGFVSWDGCRIYFNRRSTPTSATLLMAGKPR